jgi:hypothetical protein
MVRDLSISRPYSNNVVEETFDKKLGNRARARRRARARSVGILRRNKARIFPHYFVLSA